jgi:sulfotransferase
MKQFFFISGLPRSGTTLLSSILSQNPKFEASISGPLARFSRRIITESSSQGGYRFQCDETKRKKIILGMFDNYYDTPDKDVFFDTNRGCRYYYQC